MTRIHRIVFLPLIFFGGSLVAAGSAWAGTSDSNFNAQGGETNTNLQSTNSSASYAGGGTAVVAGSGNSKSSSKVSGSGNSSIVQQASNLGQGVPTVYASPLVAGGTDVCLGSLTGGGSGAGFGVTLGMTLEDKSCQLRSYARSLAILGYSAAAREEICQDPSVRAAMAAAGTPCNEDRGGGPLALANTSTQVSQANTTAPGAQVANAGPSTASSSDSSAGPDDASAFLDTYPSDSALSGKTCHEDYQVFYGWQETCK
jgi:hypothetical protein